jgi:hypothetical protein
MAFLGLIDAAGWPKGAGAPGDAAPAMYLDAVAQQIFAPRRSSW